MTVATSSGEKSADAQISTLPGFLLGVDLQPPASGAATLVIYDSENSTTSGKTVLFECTVPTGVASINFQELNIVANRGIYADLTGTTTYVVRFAPG